MKSKVFQKTILNVVLARMLGSVLVMPCVALARPVSEGRGVAAALAVESVRVLEDSSLLVPAAGGYQAPANPQHNMFAAAFHNFGTILAGALLVLPFGLSTLRILRKNRAE